MDIHRYAMYMAKVETSFRLSDRFVAALTSSNGPAGVRFYQGGRLLRLRTDAARYGLLASDHKLVEVRARIGNLALSSI
jgi:hypothetical protein